MKTDCITCGKPTWKGCGKHIEQALKDVPEDERCKCPRDSNESKPIEGIKVETKNDNEIKVVESNVETPTDNEIKIEETKEKID